jgi:8-oxo-dGTP diphosphatase
MNTVLENRIIGFGVATVSNGQILLGYQTRSYENPCWALPGGKLDKGEMIIDAVKREVKEECGIDVIEAEFLTYFEDLRKDTHIISLVAKVNEFSGKATVLEPEKCQKWQWFDFNELPDELNENFKRLRNSPYWKNVIE